MHHLEYLIWFPRLGAALSRFVLAPQRSDLRLVNIDDRWAGYLHRNLIGLVLLGGFTLFIVGFDVANGISIAETRIAYWLNTAVHIYVALIFWTAREGPRKFSKFYKFRKISKFQPRMSTFRNI